MDGREAFKVMRMPAGNPGDSLVIVVMAPIHIDLGPGYSSIVAIAYSKLLHTYSIRLQEVNALDARDLLERINKNNRKLGSLESYDAVLKLTQTIEMDERLVKEIQEEKNEVEMIGVKLDHVESMIAAFKHQIVSSNMVNPAVEEIESIVNEAMALDNVLRERRRNKADL